MFLLYYIGLLLAVATICHCEEKPHVESPMVQTDLGKIQGSHQLSFNKKQYSAFEGIPYAQPPIGPLRFRDPLPVNRWDGVWHATHVTECAQSEMKSSSSMHGSEDCLFINVYVPRDNPNPTEKLDVVVHFHGGAFQYGTGNGYANPAFFMDTDLIFVTLNYRLGILGFLSTEDDAIRGNFGLKDQVMALKWIQEHIASFGGNPASVTITGISAGGTSVHLHYMSPMSKDLFHRGISQSGVAINRITVQTKARENALKLGELVGCPTASTAALSKCLRERPHTQLLSKMGHFYGYLLSPLRPFGPVIEKGRQPFLNKDPYDLLLEKQVRDLPWLVSSTAHEGFLPSGFFYKDIKEVNEKWEEVAPYVLEYNYTIPLSEHKSVAKTIKDHYLGEGGEIKTDNFLDVVKMFSERLYLTDIESSLRLQVKANKAPVYYYTMNYPGENNPSKRIPHAADGVYLFHKMQGDKELTENELKVKDAFFEMITTFAKTGTPVIEGVTWEPISDAEELSILNITNFDRADGFKLERTKQLSDRAFWKSLGLLRNEGSVQLKDEL